MLVMDPDREETEAERLQRQEEATRDKQVGVYEVWMDLHLPSRMEKRRVKADLRALKPRVGAEIGCGPGRWTRFIDREVELLIALDRSFKSLVRNRERIEAQGLGDRVLHLKGDATRLPILDDSMDVVLSGQVIEHLPTEELRESSVAEFARILKPAGRAFVSAYQYRAKNAFVGRKEGMHAGGMYYFRFSDREFREILERHFGKVEVTSFMGQIQLGAALSPRRAGSEPLAAGLAHEP